MGRLPVCLLALIAVIGGMIGWLSYDIGIFDNLHWFRDYPQFDQLLCFVFKYPVTISLIIAGALAALMLLIIAVTEN